MDYSRLSMDLGAALEEARRLAARAGLGYIQSRHPLLALLAPDGALGRVAGRLGLDAGGALRRIEGLPNDGDAV
ncbi:MAG: Clp protease N-terminal domain-containing protein, partial [Gemmatimonadales bacterium]